MSFGDDPTQGAASPGEDPSQGSVGPDAPDDETQGTERGATAMERKDAELGRMLQKKL